MSVFRIRKKFGYERFFNYMFLNWSLITKNVLRMTKILFIANKLIVTYWSRAVSISFFQILVLNLLYFDYFLFILPHVYLILNRFSSSLLLLLVIQINPCSFKTFCKVSIRWRHTHSNLPAHALCIIANKCNAI